VELHQLSPGLVPAIPVRRHRYTAYSTTSGSGGIQEFTFPVATARTWRILATSNASSYYTLYELELFKD